MRSYECEQHESERHDKPTFTSTLKYRPSNKNKEKKMFGEKQSNRKLKIIILQLAQIYYKVVYRIVRKTGI